MAMLLVTHPMPRTSRTGAWLLVTCYAGESLEAFADPFTALALVVAVLVADTL
jgi:hypothetical protein